MDIADTLARSLHYHRAGDLPSAERLYRQVLAVEPTHSDALHLLGVVCDQTGKFDEAVHCLREAIRLKPNFAEAHFNLGNVYRARNDCENALRCFEQAIASKAAYAEAYFNKANTLRDLGRWEQAISSYGAAIDANPAYAKAYTNLGRLLLESGRIDEAIGNLRRALLLQAESPKARRLLDNALAKQHVEQGQTVAIWQGPDPAQDERKRLALSLARKADADMHQGKLAEAVASYDKALELLPDWAEVHINRGVALAKDGKHEAAAASYETALQLKPEFAEAHVNLGCALIKLERHAQAISVLEEAIRLKPNLPQTYSNLGNALGHEGKFDAAETAYRRALALQPDDAETHYNIAVIAIKRGHYQAALPYLERALEIRPEYPEAHHNRAVTWLAQGNYQDGWREYEWRWRCKDFRARSFPQPLWDGSPLRGKTILLYGEQGSGDCIQFIRFVAQVKAQGGTVIVECRKPLAPLFSTCPGIDRIVVRGESLPKFDTQAPLMSLPYLLGTTLENVPAEIPYLAADAARLSRWQQELASFTGFKIGICWQGNPKNRSDRYRSIPLRQFAPLAQLHGAQLFSLQKGYGSEQLKESPPSLQVIDLASRLDEDGGAFLDTAAVLKSLDLVITCDTAIGHLAGALGVPVWVALSRAADWRWLVDRDDSPWYPSMRLFRQAELDQWEPVFGRMVEELRRRLGPATLPAIRIEVSPGELFDKLSILEIKAQRILEPDKRKHVDAELNLLRNVRQGLPASPELDRLAKELKKVNETLWQVEDAVRICERTGDFGQRFVELARSVYQTNDHRSALKSQINELLQSSLKEIKSYAPVVCIMKESNEHII